MVLFTFSEETGGAAPALDAGVLDLIPQWGLPVWLTGRREDGLIDVKQTGGGDLMQRGLWGDWGFGYGFVVIGSGGV